MSPQHRPSSRKRKRTNAPRTISTKLKKKSKIHQATFSYDDPDTHKINLPGFTPSRTPGAHLNVPLSRNSMTRAIDFFGLFFTDEIIDEICRHTNTYAWQNIHAKKSYADKNGAWKETNPAEMKKFIACLIYQGLVKVPTIDRYWSTRSLYHGLWARVMISRERFQALLSMLHIVDPTAEIDKTDKLRKVRPLINKFKSRCRELYQPDQNVAVDERLVKSKHRSGIRQYIKNKPVKFGIKLWVVAESKSGYTWDFNVYTGKGSNPKHKSEHGLGYDVVMELMDQLLQQGYHVFFDNFYTSVPLVTALWNKNTPSCGTVTENRKGFPETMKNGKSWAKKKERGDMRWRRDGNILAVQWIDNKLVTMLSSIDCANEYVEVNRKKKINNKWNELTVKQPYVIHRYNRFMNGVDRSDQILAKYNLLRKCVRWWKTLFYHLIDIATVNGYILFKAIQKERQVIMKRRKRFSLLDFREELVRDLIEIEEFGNPPVHSVTPVYGKYHSAHLPKFGSNRRNCRVCYTLEKKVEKVFSYCSAPQCNNVPLHCTATRDCFSIWHSSDYHSKH